MIFQTAQASENVGPADRTGTSRRLGGMMHPYGTGF